RDLLVHRAHRGAEVERYADHLRVQVGRLGQAGLPGRGGTGHHAQRESRRSGSGHRRLQGVLALLLVVLAVLLLGVVLLGVVLLGVVLLLVVLAVLLLAPVLLLALVLVAVPLAVALAALVRRTGRGRKTRARDGKDEQSCNQRSEVTRETHLGVLPLWHASAPGPRAFDEGLRPRAEGARSASPGQSAGRRGI